MDRIKQARPSPAIVIAVLALVAALAGTAVGGPNATTAAKKLNKKEKKQVKKIFNKQFDNQLPLTGEEIDESTLTGLDRCPNNASSRSGDVCFGSLQSATDWDAAARACAAQDLRLPSIAEALLLFSNAAVGTTWTDEVVSTTARARVNKNEPKIEAVPPGSSQTYYCVAYPRN
jgi:hypothetical protein